MQNFSPLPICSVCLAVSLLAMPSTGLSRTENWIEEIIVSAQRVDQQQQDVPIATNSFSDPMIRDRQIVGITDLMLNVPSFNYVPNNFGGAQVNIRGIGELYFGHAGKGMIVPSAPVHVNGISTPLDISAVEVLRHGAG